MPRTKPIELGEECTDKVSGMTGKVTAVITYLGAEFAPQYRLTTVATRGEFHEAWFEVGRLRRIPQLKKK